MADRPTYLFVVPWALQHVGGVNQVVINLARQMALKGRYEPLILITDWDAPVPVWEDAHGLRTVRWRVRGAPSGHNVKQHLAHLAWTWRFARQFKAFCHDNRVAVVNPHYPTETALTLESMCGHAEPRARFILSFHGGDLTRLQVAPAAERHAWQALLKRTQATVVCSAALGRRAMQTFDCAPTVIHNGIDAEAFRQSASASVPSSRRRVLSVGKFDATKGQDVLIRAFSTIAPDHPDLDLVLIGATGNALPELKQLCADLGMSMRVHFNANVPHEAMAQHFATAHVFVLPSRQEAFGIVLLEAGCFALPVIASAVGGIPEVVEDGATALLVEPDRPDQLVNALRQVLDNEPQAKAMGARLHNHVTGSFSWSSAHDHYIQLATR